VLPRPELFPGQFLKGGVTCAEGFKQKRGRAPTREAARVITPDRRSGALFSPAVVGGEFYEDGVQIAGRIQELVPQVNAERWPRWLWKARRMKCATRRCFWSRDGRHSTHRALVAETLGRIRAPTTVRFVAIYWASGRQPSPRR